ncbi:MAG: RsmE family RNA methyltransferase [candidate division Zixibacteria bacterium]|nr:RsmE family RNA methyltransferase [candidate division Zixibacteria bacterium]
METPIFYAPPENRIDSIIDLPKDESHHAFGVLRLKTHSPVTVVDGIGMAYHGLLERGGKYGAQVHWHSQLRNYGEPNVHLTLAAGLSTGDKFDTVVQKGTELGVSRFIPVLSAKSKVKLTEQDRSVRRQNRLEKVALSAIKQCKRSSCPTISLPLSFGECIASSEPEDFKFIFDASVSKSKTLYDLTFDPCPKRITALVGPESGFLPEEIEKAISAGFIPVTLGSRILRTETAGPAVCALIMYLLGEFR